MDVNAFYKCKIIEILIEQEPSDNKYVLCGATVVRNGLMCVHSCASTSEQQQQQNQQSPTENDNKTTPVD